MSWRRACRVRGSSKSPLLYALIMQAKEKEAEAARRKRLKEKIAQYKLRIEQERAEKAVKEASVHA